VPDIAALNAVGRVVLLAEASALMEPYMARREDFGADVLALLDQGRLIPATDYVNAQRLRRLFMRQFRAVWNEVDCLFTPTTPTTAPKIGETTTVIRGEAEDVRLAATRLVRGIRPARPATAPARRRQTPPAPPHKRCRERSGSPRSTRNHKLRETSHLPLKSLSCGNSVM
jgi:hypothetical protein